jgi:hypothetical protein
MNSTANSNGNSKGSAPLVLNTSQKHLLQSIFATFSNEGPAMSSRDFFMLSKKLHIHDDKVSSF